VVTYIGIEAGINVHARYLHLAVQIMNDSEGCSRLIQVDSLIIKAGMQKK
jgi:non-canonical (house-cleaning) NTP pyrophosphatase